MFCSSASSVDPEHDTPAVLTAMPDRFGASPDRWWFLTGPKAIDLRPRSRWLQAGAGGDDGRRPRRRGRNIFAQRSPRPGDRGRVVGFFESNEPAALDELVARASRLAQPGWVLRLPAVNASLNAALRGLAAWPAGSSSGSGRRCSRNLSANRARTRRSAPDCWTAPPSGPISPACCWRF